MQSLRGSLSLGLRGADVGDFFGTACIVVRLRSSALATKHTLIDRP